MSALGEFIKRVIGGNPPKEYTHSGGKAEREAIANTSYEGYVSLPEVPIIQPEDLIGRGVVTVPYDRSRAGTLITKINDVDLKQPVDYHGGQDYMVDSPGVIAASSDSKVNMLLKAARDIEDKTGKPALFAPNMMAPTGADFSRMPVETMVQYAYSNMGRDGIKELNAVIKTIIPEFKGMGSKQAMAQIRNATGNQKKDLANVMHTQFEKNGGLSHGQARALSTAPNQLEGTTTSFQNVGEFDLSRGDGGFIRYSGHTDYPGAAAGEVVGRFDPQNMAFYDLFEKQAEKRGVTDPRNLSGKDRRSAQMNVPRSTIVKESTAENIAKKIAQGTIATGAAGKVYANQEDQMPEMSLADAMKRKLGIGDVSLATGKDMSDYEQPAAEGKIDRAARRNDVVRRKMVDKFGMKKGMQAANAYIEAIEQIKQDAIDELKQKQWGDQSWVGEKNQNAGTMADVISGVNENLPDLVKLSSLEQVMRDTAYGRKSDPVDVGLTGLEADVGAAGAAVLLPMALAEYLKMKRRER